MINNTIIHITFFMVATLSLRRFLPSLSLSGTAGNNAASASFTIPFLSLRDACLYVSVKPSSVVFCSSVSFVVVVAIAGDFKWGRGKRVELDILGNIIVSIRLLPMGGKTTSPYCPQSQNIWSVYLLNNCLTKFKFLPDLQSQFVQHQTLRPASGRPYSASLAKRSMYLLPH
jgi:hypothetical protein